MKNMVATVALILVVLTGCSTSKHDPIGTGSTTGATAGATVGTESVEPIATTILVSTTQVVVTTAPPLTVTRVIDGDTVETSAGYTIRMLGIDTPEKGQCGYEEAKDLLSVLILDKQINVGAGGNSEKEDKYGRKLLYIELDGVDINLYMIQSGRAIARYDSEDGYDNHRREQQYRVADKTSPSTNVCPDTSSIPNTSTSQNTTPQTSPQPVATQPQNITYRNCSEARAAGAAPLYAGQPGYSTKLDRDGDGVACE